MKKSSLYDIADEVVQGGYASEDMVLYCINCGKIYTGVPEGEAVFHNLKGGCSCSWNCCEAARPVGHKHADHMAYRPMVFGESMTIDTWCRNCIGARPHPGCDYCQGTGRVSIKTHRMWVRDGRPHHLWAAE